LWLHSLKVAQLLRSAACLHTNQSRSYLNHLVVSETSIVFHTKFLLVLTRVLVHRCRIRGQESRFDNFEQVSYAQNVKVVTGRLLTQETQTWERLLMCCVRQRHRGEDIGSRKCRGRVVPVCNMTACSGQKGIAPFILNGWTGWGECKHHAPAVLHQRRNTGIRLMWGCIGLRTSVDFWRLKHFYRYKYLFPLHKEASPIFSCKKLSTVHDGFF